MTRTSSDRRMRRYVYGAADRFGPSHADDVERATHKVLIVEDDPGSRRALTNVLQDRGYSVSAVGSATEALDALREQAVPDLIVLDLMLPDMEGWDFRHEQKKDPRMAGIPVIGVSAVGKLVDVEHSFRKPLDYDQFLAAVERYVGRPERGGKRKG